MILELSTILAFVLIVFGFGYTILKLCKSTKNPSLGLYILEIIAVGLGVTSLLGVLLDILHIPIILPLYVALAIVPAIIIIVKQSISQKGKTTQKNSEKNIQSILRDPENLYVLIAIIIAAILVAILYKGATGYPYLEDDDPWVYTQSSMYVATQHTGRISVEHTQQYGTFAQYLAPYPPEYSMLMGVLRQANDSIVWTLQFFNVLLIGLAVLLFYLFARLFTGNALKAILATFIIATLPSFMSHFIWSQSLAIPLFIAALFAVITAISDSTWRIPAIIVLASALIVQPFSTILLVVALAILFVCVLLQELLQDEKTIEKKTNEKKNNKQIKNRFFSKFEKTIALIIVGISGLIISLLHWGVTFVSQRSTEVANASAKGSLELFFSAYTGSYVLAKYSFKDIIFAPSNSMIDQAIGWGPIVVFGMIVAAIIFLIKYKTLSPAKSWNRLFLFIWAAGMIYIIIAPSIGLPAVGTSRAWAYAAIPIALLAAEGLYLLAYNFSKEQKQIVLISIILVFAILIGLTNIPPKVAVQTAQWPPGAHWSVPQLEIPGYIDLAQKLPKNSRVFVACASDGRVMGYDMQSEPWDIEIVKFRENITNATGPEIVSFMQNKQFKYMTIDATCVKTYGQNETEHMLQEITNTQRFSQVTAQQGFILIQLN